MQGLVPNMLDTHGTVVAKEPRKRGARAAKGIAGWVTTTERRNDFLYSFNIIVVAAEATEVNHNVPFVPFPFGPRGDLVRHLYS